MSELNILDTPVLSKAECRDHRILKTKGLYIVAHVLVEDSMCQVILELSLGLHLYACSAPESEVFQVAVAVKNRVQLYQWRYKRNINRRNPTQSGTATVATDALEFVRVSLKF